ncbi:Maf family protein [Aestuariibacter salexigens]|uniref:Maf family protein n=1 Tax=Aestuariibacter salexigens TaxID=226010 RepID=UPI000420A795|nr:Maf family protein [Aestuariibacter salexigens]
MSKLVLASQSPRRAELLTQIGVAFRQQVADIDETPRMGESAQDYVSRLAVEKALAVLPGVAADEVVLGSDTVVVVNQQVLGKPEDESQFRRMMSLLSGTTHQVLTAVCVASREKTLTATVGADVTMQPLTAQQIHWYWQSGEPHDKAGGYGIQGLGARFIKHISGSYSAVVGLPLFETTELLLQMGVIQYEC